MKKTFLTGIAVLFLATRGIVIIIGTVFGVSLLLWADALLGKSTIAELFR